MNCYCCLVNDDTEVPAVTAYDGTPICKRHADEQAELYVKHQAEEAQEEAARQARVQEAFNNLHRR
jgi:ribosomal protein L44E